MQDAVVVGVERLHVFVNTGKGAAELVAVGFDKALCCAVCVVFEARRLISLKRMNLYERESVKDCVWAKK